MSTRSHGERRPIVNLGLAVAVLALALIGLDRLLGLAGLPGEPPPRWAHPPSFRERRENLDFEYLFETNSQGLKSPEIPLSKKPGERRFLVLGDSFVEGYGVESTAAFPAILEARYSTRMAPVRFVNGGLSGAGPLEYARLYFHIGRRYEPDAILLCLFPNDLTGTPPGAAIDSIYRPEKRPLGRRLTHGLLPRIYTRLAVWRRSRAPRLAEFPENVIERARATGIPEERIAAWVERLPPQLVAAVQRDRFNGAILSSGLLTPHYWVESLELEGEEAEAKWRAMIAILGEILEISRRDRAWLGLVYVPARFQYDPAPENRRIWRQAGTEIRESWMTGATELQGRLRQWSAESEVPYLDLTSALRQEIADGKELGFPRDDHWSPPGHTEVARIVGHWLEGQGAVGPAGSGES